MNVITFAFHLLYASSWYEVCLTGDKSRETHYEAEHSLVFVISTSATQIMCTPAAPCAVLLQQSARHPDHCLPNARPNQHWHNASIVCSSNSRLLLLAFSKQSISFPSSKGLLYSATSEFRVLIVVVVIVVCHQFVDHQLVALLAEFVGFAGDEEANDKTKQTEDGAENLNDEDLDESIRFVSIAGSLRLLGGGRK